MRRVFVASVAAVNQTNAGIRVTVGVESGGVMYGQKTLVLTSDQYYYDHPLGMYVYPGEAIRFDFEAVNVSDKIECFVVGHSEFGE